MDDLVKRWKSALFLILPPSPLWKHRHKRSICYLSHPESGPSNSPNSQTSSNNAAVSGNFEIQTIPNELLPENSRTKDSKCPQSSECPQDSKNRQDSKCPQSSKNPENSPTADPAPSIFGPAPDRSRIESRSINGRVLSKRDKAIKKGIGMMLGIPEMPEGRGTRERVEALSLHREELKRRDSVEEGNPLLGVFQLICICVVALVFVLGLYTVLHAVWSLLHPDIANNTGRRASASTILFEHSRRDQLTAPAIPPTVAMVTEHEPASAYRTVERGSFRTKDYRIFFEDQNGTLISPWHDIPLFADEKNHIYNMVVEIPRWTNEKMEIATKEPLSPIRQDEKKGRMRFVHNVFPFHGYTWNYGALPQTWEDPTHKDEKTGVFGDNDPIDAIEIGSKVHKRGAVIQVKILGVLLLLDDGETDWKLITLDVNDPISKEVNSIADVENHFPGLLDQTREWLRVYKIPAGNKPNEFGFEGEYKDKEFAHNVRLVEDEALINEPFSIFSECHVDGASKPANDTEWRKLVDSNPPHSTPQDAPVEFDKWHFVASHPASKI
ncbi:inorganic pyrophosphatase domain-containing protein [Ditylenchus destructor]|nr:inorganic pyrophosphatase domain-containing protein [Ditylenchus destructor]